MNSAYDMIKDPKQMIRILRYCKHQAIPLATKSEELISIESKVTLVDIDMLTVKWRTPFEEQIGRQVCLITRIHGSSFDPQLPWPCHTFTLSFQYRRMGHSFHCRLVRFIRRARLAIFSLPEGIYKHRLREDVRIPVSAADGIRITLEQEIMEVFNLNAEGVGLFVTSPGLFRVGQVIPQMHLIIHDRQFRAEGKIRHISRCAPGKYACGISLRYVEENALVCIRKFIIRKQLEEAGISGIPDSWGSELL